MAILNIKNFPDGLYRKLRARAKQRGRSLAREVTLLLQEEMLRPKKYSIDDWRGVGAEIWRNVDVEKFIERERNSW